MSAESVRNWLGAAAMLTAARLMSIGNGTLRKRQRGVIVLPPASPGSLGDEAMVTALVRFLRIQGEEKVYVVDHTASNSWSYLNQGAIPLSLEHYFNYGSIRSGWEYLRIASQCSKHYTIGADVLDGCYGTENPLKMLELTKLAAILGQDARIVSTSINSNPEPACTAAIRRLPKTVAVCLRDKLSHERIVTHSKRNESLVADLAFLLSPTIDTERVKKTISWVSEHRGLRRIVIGLNVAHHPFKNATNDYEEVITKFSNIVNRLVTHCNISIVLISHDVREVFSDYALEEKLLSRINKEVRPYVMLLDRLILASEVKAVVEKLDLVFSCRMHLAIACLGSKTPVISVAYQGKFEGLYKHFNIDNMVISPESVGDSFEIVNKICEILPTCRELSFTIGERLPGIIDLAKKNISAVQLLRN